MILVRRPSARLAEGEVTHISRSPVDIEQAFKQWDAYIDVFRAHGWSVVELDPLDGHPDGVFVEDVRRAGVGKAVGEAHAAGDVGEGNSKGSLAIPQVGRARHPRLVWERGRVTISHST